MKTRGEIPDHSMKFNEDPVPDYSTEPHRKRDSRPLNITDTRYIKSLACNSC